MGLTKEQLKAIFKEGAVPTEAQFASMIDAALNINDTGTVELSANTLNISGSTIAKTDIDRLREGKPISGQTSITGQDITYNAFLRPEAIFSTTDNSTYQKFTIPGRVGQFVSGNLFFDQNLSGSNNYIALGKTNTTDTQFRFSGNVTASGNISASGFVQGNQIFMSDHIAVMESGDSIAFGHENNTPIIIGKTANPTTIIGHVTASGNISASGTLTAGALTVTGTTTFTGTQVGQKLTIKNITDNVDLTAAESGKLCVFSDADGAFVRLPDSGDGSLVGVYYDFYVGIAATSNTHAVACLDGTNEDFEGYLHSIDGDSASSQATAAFRALNSDGFDTIAMNGTTTGTVGTAFRITNIAADRWYVTGHIAATGAPSTPFVAS